MSKIIPLNDRVVVKPLETEGVTPGGIVMPDVAKEKPTRGKVVAVGPGKLLDDGSRAEMDLNEGDIVLYGRYAGTGVEIGREEYVMLREDDVFARLE